MERLQVGTTTCGPEGLAFRVWGCQATKFTAAASTNSSRKLRSLCSLPTFQASRHDYVGLAFIVA